MKKITIVAALLAFYCAAFAQTAPQITNVYNRNTLNLNGKWHYIIDPYETGYYSYRFIPYDQEENYTGGNAPRSSFYANTKPENKSDRVEYDFDKAPTMIIPSDWNSQEEKLTYYEGTIWFKKSFNYNLPKGKRLFAYFAGANYETHAYVNGKKAGSHIGGFTPFNFEITDIVKEKDNFIIVKVDNKRKREAVPTLNTDWWNYGGLTRDVMLVEVPEVFIEDYLFQLDKTNSQQFKGNIRLNGAKKAQKVTFSIPELKFSHTVTTNEKGYAEFTAKAPKMTYWSPENPKLYAVEIKSETDAVKDEIGFRTIEVKGTDILLNGKSIFLRGICIHEEVPQRKGRAFSETDSKMLLGWAKELNCNFVRLAHYPHNEHMIRTAERMGILVWEEIPVYWTITWENKETYQNAENQLTEIITRDVNRANIIIWSMANETPVSEARNEFLKKLAAHARKMDNSRLISAALEVDWEVSTDEHAVINDPFSPYVDVISYNQYIGWYGGLPERCQRVTWEFKEKKPVIVSEFGGGALKGFYADSLTVWSEDYQESLYNNTLKMLDKIPAFRGTTPWILADFRSPKRVLTNIQDGWNRKGLYSERGEKKKAFFTLKNFYDKKEKEYNKLKK